MAYWRMAALAGVFMAGAGVFAVRAEAATQQRDCLVDSIAVIEQRMHIKCVPIPANAYTGEITYYAMPVSEGSPKVDSVVMLAIESKRRNKAMKILFDMADYASVPGCLGHNCRRLRGAVME